MGSREGGGRLRERGGAGSSGGRRAHTCRGAACRPSSTAPTQFISMFAYGPPARCCKKISTHESRYTAELGCVCRASTWRSALTWQSKACGEWDHEELPPLRLVGAHPGWPSGWGHAQGLWVRADDAALTSKRSSTRGCQRQSEAIRGHQRSPRSARRDARRRGAAVPRRAGGDGRCASGSSRR